jgi:hypothetical protein
MVVAAALALVACSPTFVKVELPKEGAAQAQALAIKADSPVILTLADGRRLERRFVSSDATGVTVIPRYYADEPKERFEYREIARIERFESTRVMGNAGKVFLVAVLVVMVLMSTGDLAVFPSGY